MEARIGEAIETLEEGGIVAFPTDTVYGLGASSLDDAAVMKVYQAKARPHHLALPLLLGSVLQIANVAIDVPETAWVLAQQLLPGGLTLILHKAASISSLISGGGDKIAVRVPNHPIPIALVEGLGAPITGTSANRSGRPSPMTAEEVHRQLGDRVDLIVDGGICPGGSESTVIDLTEDPPRMLRQGAISREEIERVCGRKIL
jgi:L-threonylcarbamoyladenylate synthase